MSNIESIKEYFKNAQHVKVFGCESNLDNFDMNTLYRDNYNESYQVIHKTNHRHRLVLFSDENGYSEITSYKKPIRTNKLTELEKRVEVLENKVNLKKIADMPENPELKPLVRDKKDSYKTFKDAINANKILLPRLDDVVKLAEELKNYNPTYFGLDFGFGDSKSVIFEGGRYTGKNHFLNEMYKLQSRIEELEAENKAILAGNHPIKLQVGKWYKGTFTDNSDPVNHSVFCYTKTKHDTVYGYGFDYKGKYHNETDFTHYPLNNNFRLATESEVFEALKNEIKKRYKVGEYFKSLQSSWNYVQYLDNSKLDFDHFNSDEIIYHLGYVIYEKGKFAEIIDVLSKSEAEKQLGKKIID